MAQNSQSSTASRNTIPGLANQAPVQPALFTNAPRREYIPDAKRVAGAFQTPELAHARDCFADGDYARCRAEAKAVLRRKDASPEARMEAGDLLDQTAIDHGPIATAVAFLILFALMLMFVATNGASVH